MTEDYKAFLGRVCTVLVNTDSMPQWLRAHCASPKSYSQFFTGEVTAVSDHGITIRHLATSTLAFYPFPVAGVVEERVVSAKDPDYEKVARAVEEKRPPEAKPVPEWKPAADVVSIEEMTQMAKRIKARRK